MPANEVVATRLTIEGDALNNAALRSIRQFANAINSHIAELTEFDAKVAAAGFSAEALATINADRSATIAEAQATLTAAGTAIAGL